MTQSRLKILTYGTTMNETKYKNVHLQYGSINKDFAGFVSGGYIHYKHPFS